MDEDNLPVTFGEWMKHRRRTLDLTQAELAQRSGCSIFTLRKIESGERRPSKQLARLFAGALEIKPEAQQTFMQVARGELNIERLGSPSRPPAHESRPTQPFQPTPSSLPAVPNPLVGREQELSILGRFLRDRQCRMLTLIGPGGIGKTRLAIEVAALNQDFFPDKVCFVSLAALNSPSFLIPAIADGLGFTFHGQIEPRVQLLNYLRSKRALLVLDNAEHMVESAGQLAEIVECAPGVKLLVTSRERLNLPGEWVFEIHGLPVPPPAGGGPFEEFSSVALFMQAARRAKIAFELKGPDREPVIRICQTLEGMPLGIELAAAWVPVLTCVEIAQEVERSLDFLETSMRNVPPRQRSLRAAFDHSWNLLSEEERSALSRLAIFQGGFTRKAAEQVAGANLHVLQALVSKSLVRHKESGRFDLHDVVRQYAFSHLENDPLRELALDRYCEYYLRLVGNCEQDLKSAAQQETIRLLSEEMDNLRAAWSRAVQFEKYPLLGQAVRSIGCLYEAGGWLRDGIDLLELAIRALRANPGAALRQKALGQALAQQGMLSFRLGECCRALSLLEESLSLLRPLGEPALLVDPLILSGSIQHLHGNIDRAYSLSKEGQAIAEAVGDRWYTAYALFNEGYIASLLGRYREGFEQMLSGLSLWRRLGDPSATALGLNFISTTAISLGYLDEAQAFLEESLALSTQVGDRWGMGTAYRNLGLSALAQGDPYEAQALIRKSLDIFAGFVTGWDIARSLVFLGEAQAAAGSTAEARQTFLDAIRLAFEAEGDPLVLDALLGLAQLQAGAGEARGAIELAGCVLSHPAATYEAKDRASRLIVGLQGQPVNQPADTLEATTGTKPLEEIVKCLLVQSRDEPTPGAYPPSR